MIENPFYTHEFHGDYELISIGRLDLEEGGVDPGLPARRDHVGRAERGPDNAILITTWYSGTHQIWRDVYVGPEHALNPERYFIVAINQIGNGLSISPHNADGAERRIWPCRSFPKVRIGDDVVAQERLLREHFGIERLQLVIGGSMGAQQTYEWAVRFPDKVRRAAPIAGTAQNTPHDFLYTQALCEQFWSDPGWNGGEYKSNADVVDGLTRHAHIWAVMGFSTEFWKQEVWRALEFESKEAFLDGLPGALLHGHGPQRPADDGVEVAARRRRPAHRRRPGRGARPDHREDLRDADRRGHVLPAAGLRAPSRS